MSFKELDKRKNSIVEKEISEFWKKEDILQKSIENRDKYFVFYDGPAFANGFPGLHHMVSKNLKDAICKYHVMNGKKVIRKVGWDTHGLPIENHVENKLGFKSKKDIEKLGIANFNDECRKSVRENEDAFVDLTSKMGQLIDTDNPYVTYDNNYIETEWWILKKFYDEGLFYEGNKILPYCPRCGTGLASHEVAQGWKNVSVDTVTVIVKKKDEEIYFLVWTTTPWTLLSNVAICVNPNEKYLLVESHGNKLIIAEKLISNILDEYKILKTYKGSDMEGWEYEQLIPEITADKKAFYVTCDDYVTMTDGTGLVHIAPSFGLDDSRIGEKYDLPFLNPVGDDGCYKTGPWKGKLVFDADEEVIKYLKENGKIFKKQRIEHDYPHCWRCESPLIYFARPSYYIAVTKIQDKIIEANNKVNWYPSYIGEKRFANWLADLKDWAISRTRYWGAPIPFWKCECGHNEMIGSRKELMEKATEDIDESIELHRPIIDNVHIKCPKCGKEMTRIEDVLDCWFDSGSMPFAQYHYPFENIELFEVQFPANFISEGIDQTRGWFYVLLVISTFVKGESSYKNVLVNDLLLDKDGKKMSKSKGNVVEPFKLIDEYGADTIRWYFPYVSPVWTPLKFDLAGLKEVHSKFFNPLKNTYNFFSIYANADNIDPREYEIQQKDYELIDLWLLSKYNKLLKYIIKSYEEYDLNKVVRRITEFVSEDLSNWYIRRTRDRFWEHDLTTSKKAVYKTTYEVLLGLSKIIAPIASFTAEEIYQKLTDKESVHLADFPKVNESLINEEIEKRMDLTRHLISMGRNIREASKIKVRQPISEIILDKKNEKIIGDLNILFKEELNVKEVNYSKDLGEFMNYVVKPNFKTVGPILGNKIGDFSKFLTSISKEEISKLNNGETIKYNDLEINKDMVEVRIENKEGYNALNENNEFIVLNTTLTNSLLLEGTAREFVSKIQNLRKEKDFNIVDRIYIYYEENKDFELVLSECEEYIKHETLALKIEKKDKLKQELNVNEIKVIVDIEKA